MRTCPLRRTSGFCQTGNFFSIEGSFLWLHSVLAWSKYFYWPFQGGTSFVDHLWFFCLVFGMSFMFLFCLVFAMSLCVSVYMCFVVTCWERAILLALVCGVYCESVTFPLVSWVRCGTWLYRFLIFAPLLTLCTSVPCGHLLGKGWPLDSSLWCLSVSLSLFHWYPGSGVVLDCIDSQSLHSYLLFYLQYTSFSFFQRRYSRLYSAQW